MGWSLCSFFPPLLSGFWAHTNALCFSSPPGLGLRPCSGPVGSNRLNHRAPAGLQGFQAEPQPSLAQPALGSTAGKARSPHIRTLGSHPGSALGCPWC